MLAACFCFLRLTRRRCRRGSMIKNRSEPRVEKRSVSWHRGVRHHAQFCLGPAPGSYWSRRGIRIRPSAP